MKTRKCFFCKKIKRTFNVGIAMGIGGDDYQFCFDCLKDMTALEFWKRIFEYDKLIWPPRDQR